MVVGAAVHCPRYWRRAAAPAEVAPRSRTSAVIAMVTLVQLIGRCFAAPVPVPVRVIPGMVCPGVPEGGCPAAPAADGAGAATPAVKVASMFAQMMPGLGTAAPWWTLM